MTKRKAIKVPVCVHQVPKVLCARCPPTKRKATVVPDSPRRGLDALVERVIAACAEAATRWLNNEGLLYEANRVRRSVQRAGRRAAKGETT